MTAFRGTDGWHELAVRRHPRARRAKLRIDMETRAPVLTLPAGASLRRARRWVEEQRPWIEERLGALPPIRKLGPGAHFPFRGEEMRIDHTVSAPRRPQLADGALRIGGPAEAVSGRTLRWLRDRARTTLREESERFAASAGLPLAGISIGDARTRWGSCSAKGRIRYNWRLIMAPPRVFEATAAHEVAHLAHMNHGPDFHALVAELFGRDPAPERRWLRVNGPALYTIG